MSRYISEKDRQFIAQCASYCCEYCLYSDDDTLFKHQIDHIISLKHGGSSDLENLAYACFLCNNSKGSDVGTILLPGTTFIRFYNPRTDNWNDHFELYHGVIYAKSQIGQATIKILEMNNVDRIMEKKED
ncbi:HNH endonuclease signature motif containing protein [Arcicella sp. LKC2W]|uniref:HNH endonuclease n=1 Tax=Arcicella sp. LKC2W TaxID=2984198 RepID=UPI002B20A535|nr:HNH endonuclease signature motif containing protein [Arcicella sp. LKC2W]MEA5460986.1 HNH endonuclease signature motif containing protein [Arcicella sp. LKC2W]